VITQPTILPRGTTGKVPLPKRLGLFEVRVWFPDPDVGDPLRPNGRWVVRYVVHESKWLAQVKVRLALKEHNVKGWTDIKVKKVPAEGLQVTT
jgi:hypothetical protein